MATSNPKPSWTSCAPPRLQGGRLKVEFPEGFLWGAATSAHQVEGGNVNSDWWRAEQAGTVRFPSGAAAQQYSRFEEDFDLAVSLGHNAHRISVEWARIEPSSGEFDHAEIEHYRQVLAALKARGLTTYVTLHHFTNPIWFADLGGWEAKDAPQLFERYARAIVPALAEHVDVWLTINEPTTVPQQGYIAGEWPPHRRLATRAALRVIDAQADAHVLAYRAIHELVPGATVGYTVALLNWQAKNPGSAWQRFLARKLADITNWRFSDRVDGAHDLIGVQYYFTLQVTWRPHGPGRMGAARKTDLGWDIVPEGLGDVTLAAWQRYGVPLAITENGLADADDARREDFIRRHLASLRRAMDEGADVRGYLYWSLIDNFEWAYGYEPRFGLIAIDYETQRRTVRPSAWAFKRIIEEGGFVTEMQRLNDQELEFGLHEYDALRAELDRHENANFEMLKWALTGAIAIIAFALQQHAGGSTSAWAIASTVPLVVVPAGLFSLAKAQMEMRIGAYLQVFYEERCRGLNWEECLRKRSKVSAVPDALYATAMFGGYVLIGLAGLGLGWFLSDGTVTAERVLTAETAVVGLLLGWSLLKLLRTNRNSLAEQELEAFRALRDDATRSPKLED